MALLCRGVGVGGRGSHEGFCHGARVLNIWGTCGPSPQIPAHSGFSTQFQAFTEPRELILTQIKTLGMMNDPADTLCLP